MAIIYQSDPSGANSANLKILWNVSIEFVVCVLAETTPICPTTAAPLDADIVGARDKVSTKL